MITKKKVLTAVLIVCAVMAVLVIAVSIAGRDIPPPDVSDLALERIEIPAEENAYTWFDAATNVLYWPTNDFPASDILSGAITNDALVAEIVEKNTEALALIERGLQCEKLQAPEVTDMCTLMPYISKWRTMARVMALKSMHERKFGDCALAGYTCVGIVQLGGMIQDGSDSLIGYVVGLAVFHMGLDESRRLAATEGVGLAELAVLSEALVVVGALDGGLVNAMKGEYRVSDNMIGHLVQGEMTLFDVLGDGPHISGRELCGMKCGLIFQPNRTKQMFADFYRGMIRNAPLVYAEIDRGFVEEADRIIEGSRLRMIAKPNVVGRILYALTVPAVDKVLDVKCRNETSVVATRLTVACRAYEVAHGTLPDSLEDLVPEFMAEVPADPFDGKPFRYLREKGIVYSVGIDLKDSGGSTLIPDGGSEDSPYRARWKAEDAVFELGISS